MCEISKKYVGKHAVFTLTWGKISNMWTGMKKLPDFVAILMRDFEREWPLLVDKL